MTPLWLAIEALRWLAGVWLLWSLPGLRPAGDTGGDPDTAGDRADGPLAVVVPARDEAASLPRLLASLAVQTRPPAELVVVDDHSTDGTAAVARAGGATVVPAPPLPGGWTGKAWACRTGVEATTAPVLVFLDADTWLAPDGLARLAGERRRRGGLVSVQPFHVTERPYESLSAFFNVVALMGVRPARPAGAAGPCMACSRADYEAVGGHEAVRTEVAEDVALGRRFLAARLPLACLAGRETVRFRMYPDGPRALVEGWTKNFATGAGATRPGVLLAVIAWISGCTSAAAQPLLAAAGRGAGAGWAVALYAAYAAQLALMLRRVGRFPWWAAAAFPVPLAAFLAVFARSLALTVAGRPVRWRGREVPSRGRPGGGPAP